MTKTLRHKRRLNRAAKRKAAGDFDAAQSRKPNRVIQIFRAVFWALFWGVVAVHIYLLALRFVPVPYTVNMFRDEGVTKDWVSLENISPQIVYAVIGAEDSLFCAHNGIDWVATKDALDSNQSGGKRRGASGITQQTAKNVFFYNGGGYVRKAGEAYFAYAIDFVWGKRRVMEVYLNVAEWGDGYYGVEAASQARFGKSAAQITGREAALLAAVLPSPNKWRLDPPGPYVSSRASTLQSRANVVRNEGFAACVGIGKTPAPRPASQNTAVPKVETPNQPPQISATSDDDAMQDLSAQDIIAMPPVNDDPENPIITDAYSRPIGEDTPQEIDLEASPPAQSPAKAQLEEITPGDKIEAPGPVKLQSPKTAKSEPNSDPETDPQ